MSMYKSLSLKQTADLIEAVGDKQTVLAQGEMGIGKSSILKMLRERPAFKNHFFCYVDITTKDVGDFLVPKIKTVDGNEVCSFIPNEEFGIHLPDQPVVMMLDELGKAKGGVMNACLRLMQERQLANRKTAEGSVIFATTNKASEGLGDNIPPHARNRITQITVRKPNAEEWIDYAVGVGVHPAVIGAVHEFPDMLASYEDYEKPEQNPYINDPRTVRAAVVTPRSLEKAGLIVERTMPLGDDIMCHALAGTVGHPAMHNILTMVKLDNDLPSWDEIVRSPDTATVPSGAASAVMLISKAARRIDKPTMGKFMTYLNRMSKEAQGLFARTVMSPNNPTKAIAATNKEFVKWATENNYLFAERV